MTRKITPLGNNILVKIIKESTETESGIIIPENAKESPSEGEVLAVGKGKELPVALVEKVAKNTLDVMIGQKVLMKKWGGNEIKSDNPDEELRIIDYDDILAIIE